ncbi:MAG: hypothetical protein ACERKZ_06580 [Lachnotalea sp.]
MMTNQFWSAIYSYIIQDILFEQYKMYAVDKKTYLEEIVDYTLLTYTHKGLVPCPICFGNDECEPRTRKL